MSRALDDWQATWNPRARWKDTRDYLAYRGDVVSKTLELVAVWRRQKAEISSLSKNLAFLCSRLELLVEECGADDRLPEIGQPDVEALARELGDLRLPYGAGTVSSPAVIWRINVASLASMTNVSPVRSAFCWQGNRASSPAEN